MGEMAMGEKEVTAEMGQKQIRGGRESASA